MSDITITLSPEEARAVVRNGNLMANLGSVFTTRTQITVSDLESALAKLELELLMAGVER